MKRCAIILSVTFALLTSCKQDQNPAIDQRLASIEQDVKSLQTSVFQLTYKADQYGTAFLDPGEKGFQRVDTPLGMFLVAIRKVSPYADGYKINLDLGNPNFATYSNPTLKIEWGPRYDNQKITWEERQKRTRKKDVTLQRLILPGSWNNTDVIIAPANAEEIGQITLSINVNEVILNKR